ncbi:glycosyltransferase family 2 protein [Gammaproteobacteria bacterium]|nr:glycosyltransferase family 2 protein [Gammaproteobacteria bacterium]
MSKSLPDNHSPELDLSVIVPLYNEEESVTPLYEKIVAAVQPLCLNFEILFVDDGSRDDTVPIATLIANRDKRLRIVKFRRNYGQTPAMAAGIDHARGRYLVTMDGDLQNDPDDIPRFLEKLDEGYDIVVGWRHKRKDKLITRKIPSRIANWLIGKTTGVPIKDNGCSLKGYKADVIQNIPLYSEMHRFIPAMTSLAGTRIAEIKVKHHARQFGESKYGLSRIYKVLLDLISIKTLLSFFSKPLLMFASFAVISMLTGFAFIAAGVIQYTATPVNIFFSIGFLYITLALFLLMWGILGELIYKTGNLKLDEFASITRTLKSQAKGGKNGK